MVRYVEKVFKKRNILKYINHREAYESYYGVCWLERVQVLLAGESTGTVLWHELHVYEFFFLFLLSTKKVNVKRKLLLGIKKDFRKKYGWKHDFETEKHFFKTVTFRNFILPFFFAFPFEKIKKSTHHVFLFPKIYIYIYKLLQIIWRSIYIFLRIQVRKWRQMDCWIIKILKWLKL